MNKNIYKFLLLISIVQILFSCQNKYENSLPNNLDNILDNAEKQEMRLAEVYANQPNVIPRSFVNGVSVNSDSRWWTSGFFPGTLWLLYENNNSPEILRMAKLYTDRVEKEQFTTDNHDIGFILDCSVGNGFRLTKDSTYISILVQGAKSLSRRFSYRTGLIRSWDQFKDKWEFPVIIDNMMNLELLFEAYRLSGNKTFYNMAVSHADKTRLEHFRPDYSCYHVVSYDTITGKSMKKQTNQGCSDESAWARGQAWALYGFTMVYRETKDRKFLIHAQHIAKFLLQNPRMPSDGIPYWDFDAPDIPNVPRDASSGAIIASALLELCQYVGNADSEFYFKFAQKELETLSSKEYLACEGENGNFLLRHSVGNMPANTEIDAALVYADYYYVQALLRYKKIYKSFLLNPLFKVDSEINK